MTEKNLTLGSLFDGSGGFPLGGFLAGITPVWASEIEPFPIRMTAKRLPSMKHYGNVSQMDGGKIEPVDIITFGSPCTDYGVHICVPQNLLNQFNRHFALQQSGSNGSAKRMKCTASGRNLRFPHVF